MKTDMSGAAAVFGAMQVIARLGLPVRVLAIAPLAENMPSGSALRPGDVLTPRNGKTIEVLNTDAEGRLVLADGLSLAAEEEPDLIVDIATLTGACKVALGDKIAGVMGTDDAVEQVTSAADLAGERVWRLPLPDDYRKDIDSEVADMKNTGGKLGGAITAALLLKEFVGDVPWAHLDIAGPARSTEVNHYLGKGGTGFGVRTLVELVRQLATKP
jgi:leucyl aminopeptidase